MNWILALTLAPFALFYFLIFTLRNFLYDKGLLKSVKVKPRIVSVGNLSLGGTGKTPICVALAEMFEAEGKNVAIVSRGYGGKNRVIKEVTLDDDPFFVGDEALEMKTKCKADIFVGPSKTATCKHIAESGNYDVIIVDDGFQHRKLNRDTDIVVIDSSKGMLDYLPFPSGRARESVSSIKRADFVFFTRDSEKSSFFESVSRKIRELGVSVRDVNFVVRDEEAIKERLKGKKLLAVSGIGNPDSFERLLRQRLGLNIINHMKFRDHHSYTQEEVELFRKRLAKGEAEMVVTTDKDAVKLRRLGFDHFLPISIVAEIPKSSDILDR